MRSAEQALSKAGNAHHAHIQKLYLPYLCVPCAPAAQVSPHEFMQAVMAASAKRFTIDKQADPVDFLSWFLNTLHAELTGGRRKKPSIVSRCFQARSEPATCTQRGS